MKYSVLVFLCVISGFHAFSDCILLPTYSHSTFSVEVSDQSGEPIPFVNVVLYDIETDAAVTGGATDFNGLACMDSVSKGWYRVQASTFGYTTQTLDSINVGLSPETKLELHLEEDPDFPTFTCCCFGYVIEPDTFQMSDDIWNEEDDHQDSTTIPNHPLTIETMYPNPARDYFQFLNSSPPDLVQVSDPAGKLIKSFSHPTERYDVGELPSGTLIIRWKRGEVWNTARLVKL